MSESIENLEISEDNSFEENIEIGMKLLEQEEAQENSEAEQQENEELEVQEDAEQQEEEQQEAKDEFGDGLDWSGAPADLKNAYRNRIEQAKQERVKAQQAYEKISELIQRTENVKEDNTPPDEDLDPDAYDEWKRDNERKAREQDQAERARDQAERHMVRTVNDVPSDLMQFARGVLQRAATSRYGELDNDTLDNVVENGLLEIAHAARQDNVSFSKYLADKASIYGYSPNSGNTVPAKKSKPGSINMQKAIENSQNKKSLGDVSGHSKGDLTVDDLLNMDDSNFSKLFNDNKGQFKKIIDSYSASL